jgi:hypothetical protein
LHPIIAEEINVSAGLTAKELAELAVMAAQATSSDA